MWIDGVLWLSSNLSPNGWQRSIKRGLCEYYLLLSIGDVLGDLESSKALHTIDLSDLCVTLDIFVLTVPLEIEMVNDLHHNRWELMIIKGLGSFKAWKKVQTVISSLSTDTRLRAVSPSPVLQDSPLLSVQMMSLCTPWTECHHPQLIGINFFSINVCAGMCELKTLRFRVCILILFSRHPALSNLPAVHRQAVEATMTEVSLICPWDWGSWKLWALSFFFCSCVLEHGLATNHYW